MKCLALNKRAAPDARGRKQDSRLTFVAEGMQSIRLITTGLVLQNFLSALPELERLHRRGLEMGLAERLIFPVTPGVAQRSAC